MCVWVTIWVLMAILATSTTGCSDHTDQPHRSSDPNGIQYPQEPVIGWDDDIAPLPSGTADTNKRSDTIMNERNSPPIVSPPIIDLHDIGPGIIESSIDQTTATIDSDIPGHPLSPEDFEHSDTMLFEVPNLVQQLDPIELAGLFEGDITILDPQELKLLTEGANPRPSGRGSSSSSSSSPSLDAELDNEIQDSGAAPSIPSTRNAIINLDRRWPAGVIPYVISSSYKQEERATIARAISQYHRFTCIRFVPRTIERDYIHILKGDGCSSSVGRVGGAQAVSLGLGCLYVGIVMHELMHASGFWHEQSRQDRDKYITINWFNIQEHMEFNFEKYTWQKIQSLGVDYDPGSIMHYGPYAFAKDRAKPTIIPRKNQGEIGQRRAFSKSDILKLNKLYGCSGATGGVIEPTTTTAVPMTTTPPGHCEDNNNYCPVWSDLGECEKNPTWMNVNCKKSCRQCGKECQDQNTYCNYWRERGECTKNAEYMGLFCRKSCEKCHTLDDISSICEDKNRHCEAWSTMGQCRANPTYMMIYCKKACNNCVIL